MEDNETVSDNLTGTTSTTDTCYGRVRSADWQNAALIVSFVVLGLINIMVIVGNTLVILAVFIHSKLRTVTNLFIVSLALSDLLVGVAVLPFSTTYEVLDVWFFGDIWCQMWLAVDVWMCTASILNLCAISLDRFLAVSRPVSYPSIMSSKRAKVLIAVVWCVSFIICLPPLVGWNDSRNRGPGAPASAVNSIAPSLAPHQQTFTLPFDPEDLGERASSSSVVVDKRSVAVATRSSQIFPQLDSNNDLRSSADRDEEDDGDSKSPQGLWATLVLPDPPGANRVEWDYPDSWNDSYQSSNSTGPIRTDWDTDIGDFPSAGNGGSRGPSVSVPSSPGVEGSGSSVGVRGVGLHTAAVNVTATCVCQLINDKGYRIYSSLGSFYLPMLVMMFFYWRIYRAAVETTRAINQGFRTTKSGSSIGGRFDEQRLTLRIHRGKSTSDLYSKANGATTYEVGHSSFRCSGGRGFGQTARGGGGGGARQATAHLHQNNHHRRHQKTGDVVNRIDNIPAALGPNARGERRRAHRHNPGSSRSSAAPSLTNKPRKARKSRWMLASVKSPDADLGNDGSLIGAAEVTDHLMSHRDAIVMTTSVAISGHKSPPTVNAHEPVAEVDNRCGEPQTTTTAGAQLFSKMGKRNIKAQVKRFKMETKAAKTLGIIVGGFILCWLPFFTIYLIGAFCEADCIPDSLFSVFFWLGYCNSAINPCVYALFSRDFRHAFKKILCRCALRDDHNVKERIVTMFPAMHLTSFFEESEEGSNSH